MKKAMLVAAASLFVIGQVFAQGQTPAPSGPKSGQENTQQKQQKNAGQMKANNKGQQAMAKGKARYAKTHKRGHRMAHRGQSQRMAGAGPQQGQQQMQGFGMGYRGPQKLTCRPGQKPDGITCM
jgi:hypothetical protein